MQDRLIRTESQLLNYQYQGQEYLVKTKYIPELSMYLLVEAKLEDFTSGVENTFYANLAVSLLVTFIVTWLVLMTMRSYNRKLEFMATNDVLTELLNRRAFETQLQKYHSLAKRNRQPLSVLFIDIDDFKLINDRLGHHVGDLVLKRLAKVMQSQLRTEDLLARWGGEEFIIALSNSDQEKASKVAEKLRLALEQDYQLTELAQQTVTASFGVCEAGATQSVSDVITMADHAMYESKKGGKNRVSSDRV